MPTAPQELDNQYIAIPFSLEHYAFMQELFQSAFGLVMTESTFRKRFNTKSLGNDVIGFLAIHRVTKTPAAYYGVFPVKLLWQGKTLLAAQSGDTMTHERHRKKGLFIWLAQKTFDECREKGIALVFGLPNQNSYPGFIKRLHWIHLDNIATYDLKLKRKTVPLAKLFLKARLFSIYVRMVKLVMRKRLIKTVTEFHNPLADYVRVNRDAPYLAYKSAGNKFFLQLDGVRLWVSLTDVFWIGDFDDYSRVTEAIIKKLKRIAATLGYNTIRFHFNEVLPQPAFLQWFTKGSVEPSCFYYIDEQLKTTNLLLTAADFDTW